MSESGNGDSSLTSPRSFNSKEKNESIRKAVMQARMELGSMKPMKSSFLKENDEKPSVSRKTIEQAKLVSGTAKESAIRAVALAKEESESRKNAELWASATKYAVALANDMTKTCELAILPSTTWDDICSHIAGRLQLLSKDVVSSMVLVDGSGDELSPKLNSLAKFNKIKSNYNKNENMKFLVFVDEQKVEELEKEREQQEYLATTKPFHFRLYDGQPFAVNVPENCSWDKLREVIATEAQISPDWILHFVLVDAEGDELSPPLNSEEKFWRFGRNITDEVGDVFYIHVDEEQIAAFEKEQEREKFFATSTLIRCFRHGSREVREVYIPNDASWDVICSHFAASWDGIQPEWITHLLLLDSERDILSPTIDSDVKFWKICINYEFSNGMIFEVFVDAEAEAEAARLAAEEAFKAAATKFMLYLAPNASKHVAFQVDDLLELYVMAGCSWEELTTAAAKVLGFPSKEWINHFVLIDREGDPLSPFLNNATKFWKVGKKYSITDGMVLVAYEDEAVKEEALKLRALEEFRDMANSFQVCLKHNPERKAVVYVHPECSWEDVRKAITEEMHLPAPAYVSQLILVDGEGDELSPPIEAIDKFWRFYHKKSKSEDMPSFIVIEDEVLLAAEIQETARLAAAEEEERLRRLQMTSKYIRVSLAWDLTTQTSAYIPFDSTWDEIKKAVESSSDKIMDANYISHFALIDAKGREMSVPICNAKKFWKFAATYDYQSGASFALYANDAWIAENHRLKAEKAKLAQSRLLRVALDTNPSVAHNIHVPFECTWETIIACVASEFHVPLDSRCVKYIVLVDEDKDQLSPPLTTDAKFWGIFPLFRINEDMLFIVYIDKTELQRAEEEKKIEEFRKSAKQLKVCLTSDLNKTMDVYIPHNCLWEEIATALSQALCLESVDWIESLVLVDGDGDELSPTLNTASLFWKTAADYQVSDGLYFAVRINEKAVAASIRLKAEQEYMRVAKSFNVYLASKPKRRGVVFALPNCSWADLSKLIQKQLHLDDATTIKHVILIDDDNDELSPALSNSSKFWKIYSKKYVADNSMAFAVHVQTDITKSPHRLGELIEENSADIESLTKLLQSGADVNALDKQGLRPVHIAAKIGRSDILELLKSYGASLDALDSHGFSALHNAVEAVNENTVKVLCHLGANINVVATVEGMTPLHYACLKNKTSMVKLLLTLGARPNCRDAKGRTALHLASAMDTSDACRLLLQQGSFIHVDDHLGDTCLHAACRAGQSDIAVALVKLGANKYRINKSNMTAIEVAISGSYFKLADTLKALPERMVDVASIVQYCSTHDVDGLRKMLLSGADPNALNENGSSAIHFAAMHGHVDMLELLHDAGAEINNTNKNSLSPLHCACRSGHLEACQWLVNHGVDPVYYQPGAPSLIHLAAGHGRTSVLSWLLSISGINASITGPAGTTALYDACFGGYVECVALLIKKGCNGDIPEEGGLAPVHIAAQENHAIVVQYLVDAGVRIDCVDAYGRTPFMIACSHGHLKLAQWLLHRGAKINHCDGTLKSTALHLCVEENEIEGARWLVQMGCITDVVNDNGDTPLDIALSLGHVEIAELLQESSTFSPAAASVEAQQSSEDLYSPFVKKSTGNDSPVDILKTYSDDHRQDASWKDQTEGMSLLDKLEIALDSNDFDEAKNILQDIVEGADESIRLPHGSNALHFAAASNHLDLAQYLIISGFDINAPTTVGRTPLHYAAFKGHLKMAKYLFSVGANPDCVDNNGRSPMMLAKRNGHKDMIQWFATVSKHAVTAEAEAPVKPKSSLFFSCVPVSSQKEPTFVDFTNDTCDNMMQTGTQLSPTSLAPGIKNANFLHNACAKGDYEGVKHWLSNGVPANAPDANKTTGLHFACVSGKMDVVQLLIKHGGDVNAQNDGGMTPLHIACDKEHGAIALFLIRQGASVDIKNNNGDSPLHVLCSRGMEVLLQEIVDLPRSVLPNMDLNALSNSGINLLHCAADSGSLNVVSILIANEVDVNATDDGGKTPLHYACSKGYVDIVARLIENGAQVDPIDSKGRTPFLLACSTGNLQLAQYLVQRGASTSIESERGNTALHVACRFGNLQFVQWLVNEGLDLGKMNIEHHTPVYYAKVGAHDDIIKWVSEYNNGHHSQHMEFEDSDTV